MQTMSRYFIAILVSIGVMVIGDFLEKKVGIKMITFMGISVLVWASVYYHVSMVAKDRQEQLINKICFYLFLMMGAYAIILGIIHSIKKY